MLVNDNRSRKPNGDEAGWRNRGERADITNTLLSLLFKSKRVAKPTNLRSPILHFAPPKISPPPISFLFSSPEEKSFLHIFSLISDFWLSSLSPMGSSIAFHSFHCKVYRQRLTVGRKLISPPVKRNISLVSCVKAPDAAATAISDAGAALEKSAPRSASFPNGFEALVLEVCDGTEIAELKLKVGDFEMHLRRNVGATKVPLSNISPIEPPPIPTKPMDVSAPVAPAPPSPPKSSTEKTTPFTNVSFGKSSKLAALEASGATGYVLVASPTVGSFRRNRTVKGKRQPPVFKEGNVIKEGQVIGYLDQFGTELPVKSDVAGEVLKILFDDGDAVGYGDPLIAVLPSFHGITK